MAAIHELQMADRLADAMRELGGSASIDELTKWCRQHGVCSSRNTVIKHLGYMDRFKEVEVIDGRPRRYRLINVRWGNDHGDDHAGGSESDGHGDDHAEVPEPANTSWSETEIAVAAILSKTHGEIAALYQARIKQLEVEGADLRQRLATIRLTVEATS